MRNDKFLLGILIFIGLLVVTALVLFAADRSAQEYQPDGTPEAAVHNYTLALTLGDYDRAYGYVADGEFKPAASAFRAFFSPFDPLQNYGLRVGEADIIDDEAVVDVTVLYGSTGPFDPGFETPTSARLALQEGEWKIVEMPYPFWEYSWLREQLP